MNSNMNSLKKISIIVIVLASVAILGWLLWVNFKNSTKINIEPISKKYYSAEIAINNTESMTLKSVNAIENNKSITPNANDAGKVYYARLIQHGQEVYHTTFRVPVVIGEQMNPNTGKFTNSSKSLSDTQFLTLPYYGRSTSIIITDENNKVILNETLNYSK